MTELRRRRTKHVRIWGSACLILAGLITIPARHFIGAKYMNSTLVCSVIAVEDGERKHLTFWVDSKPYCNDPYQINLSISMRDEYGVKHQVIEIKTGNRFTYLQEDDTEKTFTIDPNSFRLDKMNMAYLNADGPFIGLDFAGHIYQVQVGDNFYRGEFNRHLNGSLALGFFLGCAAASLLLLIMYWVNRLLPEPRIGICAQCGYDLCGISSNKCPECGFMRFELEETDPTQ